MSWNEVSPLFHRLACGNYALILSPLNNELEGPGKQIDHSLRWKVFFYLKIQASFSFWKQGNESPVSLTW